MRIRYGRHHYQEGSKLRPREEKRLPHGCLIIEWKKMRWTNPLPSLPTVVLVAYWEICRYPPATQCRERMLAKRRQVRAISPCGYSFIQFPITILTLLAASSGSIINTSQASWEATRASLEYSNGDEKGKNMCIFYTIFMKQESHYCCLPISLDASQPRKERKT